jgi:hypothetical protein
MKKGELIKTIIKTIIKTDRTKRTGQYGQNKNDQDDTGLGIGIGHLGHRPLGLSGASL